MDRPTASYLVGFTMRSPTHDYGKALKAMEMLKARQVSPRIWLCAVTPAQRSYLFAMFKFCLAVQDHMIVEEAPEAFVAPSYSDASTAA